MFCGQVVDEDFEKSRIKSREKRNNILNKIKI